MSEESPPLRRILVALDGSPHSRAALRAAVRLAQPFEAEIEGLFVEDERLLRAARLPFATEVRAYTAPPKRLSDQRMQRQLRYQASHAERALRRAAEQTEVPHDFRTVQGEVTAELRRAAAEVDLLVLGKTSTASSRRRLGSTSRTLLAEAPSPVLVLRRQFPVEKPLLVYYDGSETGETALRLATQLARRAELRALDVLLPAHDEAETERLREQVRTRHDDPDVPIRLHPLTRAEGRRLSAFTRANGGLVILPSGCPSLGGTSLQQFLYEIDRPLLVVR
jgi:nucleotide-binding universal stress UspA family protein